MQEPANMPLEVLCQERAMKQELTVYQFQSIEILQEGVVGAAPPPEPPPIPPCEP